jgi:hypothetical protein
MAMTLADVIARSGCQPGERRCCPACRGDGECDQWSDRDQRVDLYRCPTCHGEGHVAESQLEWAERVAAGDIGRAHRLVVFLLRELESASGESPDLDMRRPAEASLSGVTP